MGEGAENRSQHYKERVLIESLHQLSRAPLSEQRLCWQAHGLHGSAPGPLYVCYGC